MVFLLLGTTRMHDKLKTTEYPKNIWSNTSNADERQIPNTKLGS